MVSDRLREPAAPPARSTSRTHVQRERLNTLKDGTVYVVGHQAPLQSIRDRYGNETRLTWWRRMSGERLYQSPPASRRRTGAGSTHLRRRFAGEPSRRPRTSAERSRIPMTAAGGWRPSPIREQRHDLHVTARADGVHHGWPECHVADEPMHTSNRLTSRWRISRKLRAGLYDGRSGNMTQTDVTDPRGRQATRVQRRSQMASDTRRAALVSREPTITRRER